MFECRARVYISLLANAVPKRSVVGVFLSLHGAGTGYLVVPGLHSVPKAPLVKVDSVVNFTYGKEGGYHLLHLGQRSPAVTELFEVLKYDDIRVKFIHVDSNDYIVSSPIETLMLCTVD